MNILSTYASVKDIFSLLIQLKITPNQLFVLQSCKEGRDYGTYIPSVKIELARLRDKEWLDEKFTLTPAGEALLEKIDSLFQLGNTMILDSESLPVPATTATASKVDKTAMSENVDQYRKLFPAGSIAGRTYRNSVRELLPRFQWFFKHHSYSWEIVLQATERYIRTKKQQDGHYSFVRTSAYFIRKTDAGRCDISELANWCEVVENERDNPESAPDDFRDLYKYV